MEKSRNFQESKWPLKILLFVLLLFNGFGMGKLYHLQSLAIYTVDITLHIGLIGFLLILYAQRWDLERYKLILAGVCLYLGSIILTEIINLNQTSDDALLTTTKFLCFFLMICLMKWEEPLLVIFAYLANMGLLLFTVHWFNNGMPWERYISFFYNPNVSGVFFSCLFILVILGFKQADFVPRVVFSVGLIGGLIIIYASTSRAIYLMLLIMLGARVILHFSRKWFSRLFFIMMGFNAVFLFLYSFVAQTNLAKKLDTLSITYLDKSFFSGRQHIWTSSLEYIMKSPMSGYFLHIRPFNYMPGTHYNHTHNQYVQVLLESGLVGLICFVIMLYVIWRVLQKGLESSIVVWVACFFIGLLFYQSFEISLFFIKEPVGLLQWFILGVGISIALRMKQNTRNENIKS